jgi:hypothetical protein
VELENRSGSRQGRIAAVHAGCLQINDQFGPFGEFTWNYRPGSDGINAIQIEAVDSAGNVSDPLVISLTFTQELGNETPNLNLISPLTVLKGETFVYDF